MFRGTTQTFKFELPFYASEITKLNVAFSQNDTIVVEKTLSDCTASGKNLTLTLDETDTLKFSNTIPYAKVQLRVGAGSTRLASEIITFPICPIIKQGALT